MNEKAQDATFFDDKRFLTDLEGKLQGKNQFANKMLEHIQLFSQKLEVFHT